MHVCFNHTRYFTILFYFYAKRLASLEMKFCLVVLSNINQKSALCPSTRNMDGWIDGRLAILCPFQQYFSHIRTMGGW